MPQKTIKKKGHEIEANKKINDLKDQLNDTDNKYKRALADYVNLEKRTKDQRAQFITLAQITIIEKLLPILDDLKRAAEHIDDVGLDLVIKQFVTLLENENIKPYNPLNESFDAKFMECTQTVPGPKDIVTKVELTGYSLRDTIIRPAKVHVGNGDKK